MAITYQYSCPTCGTVREVEAKMSEIDSLVVECPEHGDMVRDIVNNNKHLDNTETRKGYHNSNEGGWG